MCKKVSIFATPSFMGENDMQYIWTKNYTRSLNRNMELYPDNEEAFYFCDDLISIF